MQALGVPQSRDVAGNTKSVARDRDLTCELQRSERRSHARSNLRSVS